MSAPFSNIENTAIVARLAGFTGSALVTIVAIAGCESGWNPQALNNNPSTGDYSVGLFQINYYAGLMQPRTQQYGSPQQLLADPLAQAKAAYSISNGGANFTPWSTYQAKANQRPCYIANLPAATAAVAATAGASDPTWQTGSDTTLISASTSGSASSTSGSASSSADDKKCLLYLPSAGPLGGGCLIHQSNVRAIAGAGILVAGGIVTLAGLILLIGHSGTARSAMRFAGPLGASANFVAQKVPDRNERLARRAERNPGPSRMPAPVRYNSQGDRVNSRGQLINERGETFL